MDNKTNEKTLQSVLKMDHMVFDELSFKRLGFQQKSQHLENTLETIIEEGPVESVYMVTLKYTGHLPEEYIVKVMLTGYFRFDGECDESIKKSLLQNNATAILFPYLRAELTLLTAQPETTPIVMPVYNINAMMELGKKED